MPRFSFMVFYLLLLSLAVAEAQSAFTEICPGIGIQPRSANFEPGGIILTAYDSAAIWVYDIGRDTRYPLPETRPCTVNCHLSPDARWISYLNPETAAFSKMRLDGTERTSLVSQASDVLWWNEETLLVWTSDQRAYLQAETDTEASATFLSAENVLSIQPNGLWALALENRDDEFVRTLINLETRNTGDEQQILLGVDRPYFNAAAWSPDGRYLAYVAQGAFDDSVGIAGGELFLASPNSAIPQQMSFLFNDYGAVRINAYAPDDLSWSPDSSRIAFWVTELLGTNPAGNTGQAVLHMLDVRTGEISRYCAFSTNEHTPETPRIIWSPDGTHIAFAGNVTGDDKGALLLAVNVESGIFTELNNGMYPVYGIPQLIAWGYAP